MSLTIDYKKQIAEDLNAIPEDKLPEIAKAIHDFKDDINDIRVALDRLKNPGRRWTMDEVEKELGLDS